MDVHSKRPRHNKSSRSSRKPRPMPLVPIISGEMSSPHMSPHLQRHSIASSSGNNDPDRFNDIIDNITSDADDPRGGSSSFLSVISPKNVVEPISPPINDNRSGPFALPARPEVARDGAPMTASRPPRSSKKASRNKDKAGNRLNSVRFSSPAGSGGDERNVSLNRRRSIGDERRHSLTEHMDQFLKWLESAQHSILINMNDNQTSLFKRKQYATSLWLELKTFFNGINTLDETGIELERRSIDRQRGESLDSFYSLFNRCEFELTQHHFDSLSIERRSICEYHLEHCTKVDQSIRFLFAQWDHILSLFPSQAVLEQFDKRFDAHTQEGRMFYEKLFVFQAWYNLHAEINRLLTVLGRIMTCSTCYTWPHTTSSSTFRLGDNTTINVSRPPTPTSTSSSEPKDMSAVSPPGPASYLLTQTPLRHQLSTVSSSSRLSTSSSFSTTPESSSRRNTAMSSMPSMDNIHQQPLTPSSPLTEYYYRYVDDQLTHARVELIASIFRSKHGPLMQRLRYAFRKQQTTSGGVAATVPTTFDNTLKNHPILPTNVVLGDYLIDAGPEKLMDEFFTLNNQLQQQKNPALAANKKKKVSSTTMSDQNQVVNILGRFDRNPTLTSSTFPPASAPTLVLKLSNHDRTLIKRQTYFLDYLDPTLFPHLPGSTLFPDPCLFLDNSILNSSSQLTSDESILITKMLTICQHLYEKHVWADSSKFSDMCELFHLPSLYPQYVFLVQIPFDIMLAWYQYHHDRKIEQTSTTGALLLLIDECKVFIHSATLIRHYVKTMITDVFEKTELNLIETELSQFDRNIIDTLQEIIVYIERYTDISLRSNLFHHCINFLKEQWRSLKKYSTMMNIEEILGEKFLHMWSCLIKRFHDYIDIFPHISTLSSDIDNNNGMSIEQVKKKMHRKYQKKLIMDMLREAKAIYDECALTINIYLQKPVCRRFLLILKTAKFERIKHASGNDTPSNNTNKDHIPKSKCLLFAPAEYFEDNDSKDQIARTLSSSFRININTNLSGESAEDQQQSPNAAQQLPVQPVETPPPPVYLLSVPVSTELESEWRGVTHILPPNKALTSIKPINTNWKTTSIFLLTQQTAHLDKFEESFKERLSKTNVQQSDLYKFHTLSGQKLQKRSCFEQIDRAMCDLAHAILSLSNCVASNVKKFEEMIDNADIHAYVHTEERAFAFGMDIIRETSYFATQLEQNTLQLQANRQLIFASAWLNFVYRKKSTTVSKHPGVLPMWSLPGINFLKHICSLQFTSNIDDETFATFYQRMQVAIDYLRDRHDSPGQTPSNGHGSRLVRRSLPITPSTASSTKHGYDSKKRKKFRGSRIEQLEKMDRFIDRQRAIDGLIGKIKQFDERSLQNSFISRKMQEDLAILKIRNFHKLSLLARGKFATAYTCTVDNGEVLCYKQYKIQHNDAAAIAKVLEQLVPLMHIKHENLIKYRGIALEHDHILFFMEYCSHGTIAQLLLGTLPPSTVSSSHVDLRRTSLECSIVDTSPVTNGIIQTNAGFAFFDEQLAQHYLRQLVSALACLHEREIIHRDIRNVNIFLTDSTKQSIKLGDVNFVYDFKFMQKKSSAFDVEDVVNIRESIAFYAPETLTQNETTIKSDIWSLGCTLLHMLTGRIPWTNRSIVSNVYYLKVISWVANGMQPTIPNDLSLSPECIDLLEQCFRHDPNRRPSSADLLQHPFVKTD